MAKKISTNWGKVDLDDAIGEVTLTGLEDCDDEYECFGLLLNNNHDFDWEDEFSIWLCTNYGEEIEIIKKTTDGKKLKCNILFGLLPKDKLRQLHEEFIEEFTYDEINELDYVRVSTGWGDILIDGGALGELKTSEGCTITADWVGGDWELEYEFVHMMEEKYPRQCEFVSDEHGDYDLFCYTLPTAIIQRELKKFEKQKAKREAAEEKREAEREKNHFVVLDRQAFPKRW